MKSNRLSAYILLIFTVLGSCMSELNEDEFANGSENELVVLLIDEDGIDNGDGLNNFSEIDVNDDKARVGLREQLSFFKNNAGKTIELNSGQMGDEAWFALTSIPNTWINAGPTDNGTENFLAPGPGLGSPNIDDDREVLLDDISGVTPLRATGLKMLEGKKVLAVVYDSDININYSPMRGNLKGENLGLVAFEVISIRKNEEGSSSSLPIVKIQILDVDLVMNWKKVLFSNPPVAQSSSEPFDIIPPASAIGPSFVNAN
ncbi:hypothetical protein [Mongoliibacter ruber]|uniref:Uncharacterized protein n=1 Tax=Mongoliibacter ruber TaxID=1750599 RepID=A0A2T0WK88_9BACT|nr:hypothetical protein [Mongoliibacter ruber]PRY87119.1 hypothetical protein CLW00_107188 [Mongoliibacter ruber]